MDYNLYAPTGVPLTYPHFTKWVGGEVDLVTDPKKTLAVNDVVFVASESRDPTGETIYSYYKKRARVIEVLEERKAKGEHHADFVPVFQKIVVHNIE